MRFTSALLLAGLLAVAMLSQGAAAQTAVGDKEIDDDFRRFVAGDYAMVGRRPDSGPAYSGTARIELRGETLVLTRKIGQATTVYEGALERADPPSDRPRVFRFRWAQGKSKMLMTCLMRADLDNFARLTCEWADNPQHKDPGLEAFFQRKAVLN